MFVDNVRFGRGDSGNAEVRGWIIYFSLNIARARSNIANDWSPFYTILSVRTEQYSLVSAYVPQVLSHQ